MQRFAPRARIVFYPAHNPDVAVGWRQHSFTFLKDQEITNLCAYVLNYGRIVKYIVIGKSQSIQLRMCVLLGWGVGRKMLVYENVLYVLSNWVL